MVDKNRSIQIQDHYTDEKLRELKFAFDMVSDPDDWRGPIDAIIPKSLVKIVAEAIVHHTGTVPAFTERTPKSVRVTAIGFRAYLRKLREGT